MELRTLVVLKKKKQQQNFLYFILIPYFFLILPICRSVVRLLTNILWFYSYSFRSIQLIVCLYYCLLSKLYVAQYNTLPTLTLSRNQLKRYQFICREMFFNDFNIIVLDYKRFNWNIGLYKTYRLKRIIQIISLIFSKPTFVL